MIDNIENPLEQGVNIIRRYVKRLPESPGVYRMLDVRGDVLYVGKAKALKRRVNSYTQTSRLPIRLQRMVAQTRQMEFVTTPTEVAALLLEANLIKKFQPTYNILLKDGKSFPYILIDKEHPYPKVSKHRGAQKKKGHYYGPFPSAGAVNQTITAMYKGFMLRNCSDNVFENRDRPCLQYHIKRCSAPCVGYASLDDYKRQVRDACDFLEGRTEAIKDAYLKQMEQASAAQEYEKAAQYRDRVKALSYVRARQDVNLQGIQDADVMGVFSDGHMLCVQVFFFRAGQNLGNRPYFLKKNADQTDADILSIFMAQFYQNKPAPKQIYVALKPSEKVLIEMALAERAGHKVSMNVPARGEKKKIIDWVNKNAKEALERKTLEVRSQQHLLREVAGLFDLEDMPKRIEVYDNSHISGTNMVGAMIVAGLDGFEKNAYRKFNIKEAKASDDFGMMREVMARRFSSVKNGDFYADDRSWPDLLLIDGGKGQFSAVKEVLEDIGVWADMRVVAISKGADRNAGREQFHMEGHTPFVLPEKDPVLHYLQRLRDEAHRFAISAHRTRRKKDIQKSPLDSLPNIGPKRKKALLNHYGSAKAVMTAGVEDLQKIDGISKALAEKIYAYFHQIE